VCEICNKRIITIIIIIIIRNAVQAEYAKTAMAKCIQNYFMFTGIWNRSRSKKAKLYEQQFISHSLNYVFKNKQLQSENPQDKTNAMQILDGWQYDLAEY